MPYPDSKYPSVIREMTPTQSLRLMNAAPRLLSMLKWCVEFYGPMGVPEDDENTAEHDTIMLNSIAVINEATGGDQ